MKKAEIEKIDKETIDRYNKRYDEFGVDARTLGWSGSDSQRVRFITATSHVQFRNKSVLDIGCGFADFYRHLRMLSNFVNYKGIDINDVLLKNSRVMFPDAKFENRNILTDNFKERQADITVMFGLLNFKLKDNLTYTKKMIEEAWKITKETLIVDFLSSNLDKNYPKEDAVYYHNPKDVLDICFKLTNDVLLIHDYQSIPQKEFMVILRR